MSEETAAKALSLLQRSVKSTVNLEHPWLHWFLYGSSGCLDEDTYLAYQIRTKDGKRQNVKGGTIKRLFHRFHGIPHGGKGSYQRPETEDSSFYLQSVDDAGRVFHNRVVGVVKSGVKPCFRVETKDGDIVATADHKFMVDGGFKPCGDLVVGEFVFVHNKTRWAHLQERVDKGTRAMLYLKQHPTAPKKVVKDAARGYANEYFVVPRARAVVEAAMNGLTLDAYVAACNAGKKLEVLPKSCDVHHRDEDRTNDALENLEVLHWRDHIKEHHQENIERSRFGAVLSEILSITPVGERETYDVQMAAPYNNFVAAGFVVHNSGKTMAAASFPRPLFLVPANENSIVTLLGMDIPYIEITGQHGPINKGRGGMEAALALIENEYKRDPDNFPYDTLVVESLTHYQDLVQEELTENNAQQMDQRKWGLMASHFRNIQMRLRNLEVHVVFTALDHVRENDAGLLTGGPMLAGQTAGKLPSACDIVGYLEAPANKKGKYTAYFRRRSHYFARSRFRDLPATIEDFKYAEIEQYLKGDKKLKG